MSNKVICDGNHEEFRPGRWVLIEHWSGTMTIFDTKTEAEEAAAEIPESPRIIARIEVVMNCIDPPENNRA